MYLGTSHTRLCGIDIVFSLTAPTHVFVGLHLPHPPTVSLCCADRKLDSTCTELPVLEKVLELVRACVAETGLLRSRPGAPPGAVIYMGSGLDVCCFFFASHRSTKNLACGLCGLCMGSLSNTYTKRWSRTIWGAMNCQLRTLLLRPRLRSYILSGMLTPFSAVGFNVWVSTKVLKQR
jgi:hypothetical protein